MKFDNQKPVRRTLELIDHFDVFFTVFTALYS